MKVTLILVFLVAITAIYAKITFQAGLGFDLFGNHNVNSDFWDGAGSDDVSIGISPYAELMAKKDKFLYGAGIEYQLWRNVELDSYDGKMGFVPIYGVLRYQLPLIPIINPELIAQLGYNFFTADYKYVNDGDVKGSVYWGLGAGIVVSSYVFQVMVKTGYGSWEHDAVNSNVTYTRLNVSGGIRF